jgi:rhodanese-related sulfurtransferase
VADRAGVRRIDRAGLDDLLRQDRTVYRFDVRDPEEHRAGHPSGFLSAPGGQLVQETDRYAPVRGAVIVLADDDGSEASMTGSWLAQMGWTVVVLDGVRAGDGGETGPDPARSPVPPDIVWCEPDDLADDALHAARTVLDVDTSVRYRAGHVPGAIWVRRHDPALRAGRLTVSGPGPVVVTSHDDLLTAFAARDLAVRLGVDVVGLRGGTARWATTHPLETGDGRWGSDPVDVYRRPYEGTDVQPSAMQAYLDWEYGLVEQLGRDATHNFTVLDFSVLDFSVLDVGVRQSPPVPPATVP